MNNDTSVTQYGSNTGVSTETSPFLANSSTYRGTDTTTGGGIIDKLDSYYSTYIPEGLKSHIVKKYHKVPTRYQSGKNLIDDSGSKWADLPYLWIPYYREVWGVTSNSDRPTATYESHMKQYYPFTQNTAASRTKYDKKYLTSRAANWWCASAHSGSANGFCYVGSGGSAYYGYAYGYNVGVPLCFRFMKDKPHDPKDEVTKPGTSVVCLLKDDNGVVTSDYGFTYENLSGILNSGNYTGYIKDGDWIELNTSDGGSYKMYANVDTYYGEGESGKEIGHHIDFISEELIYGSTSRTNGSNNYSATDINSWRMNYDTTWESSGNNNGVSTETSPFLANSTAHRGAQGGIIDKLDSYYSTYIPEGLKSHIVKKYHKVPTRYQNGSKLTDDNGSKWAEMPYLWIPYYKEVLGDTSNSYYKPTATYESHMKQYHSFKTASFRQKIDKKDTKNSAWSWWTASANSGDTSSFCDVDSDGGGGGTYPYIWNRGCPLCFRFQ